MDLSIWGSRSYKNLYAYIKEIVFLLFGNVSAHLWIIIRIYENIEGKAIVYIKKKKGGGVGMDWRR